ncbi:hypothetical protein Tco_0475172 [Tanacetum coccineum]
MLVPDRVPLVDGAERQLRGVVERRCWRVEIVYARRTDTQIGSNQGVRSWGYGGVGSSLVYCERVIDESNETKSFERQVRLAWVIRLHVGAQRFLCGGKVWLLLRVLFKDCGGFVNLVVEDYITQHSLNRQRFNPLLLSMVSLSNVLCCGVKGMQAVRVDLNLRSPMKYDLPSSYGAGALSSSQMTRALVPVLVLNELVLHVRSCYVLLGGASGLGCGNVCGCIRVRLWCSGALMWVWMVCRVNVDPEELVKTILWHNPTARNMLRFRGPPASVGLYLLCAWLNYSPEVRVLLFLCRKFPGVLKRWTRCRDGCVRVDFGGRRLADGLWVSDRGVTGSVLVVFFFLGGWVVDVSPGFGSGLSCGKILLSCMTRCSFLGLGEWGLQYAVMLGPFRIESGFLCGYYGFGSSYYSSSLVGRRHLLLSIKVSVRGFGLLPWYAAVDAVLYALFVLFVSVWGGGVASMGVVVLVCVGMICGGIGVDFDRIEFGFMEVIGLEFVSDIMVGLYLVSWGVLSLVIAGAVGVMLFFLSLCLGWDVFGTVVYWYLWGFRGCDVSGMLLG